MVNDNNKQNEPEINTISIYTTDPGPPKFRFLFLEPTLVSRITHLAWPVIIGMLTQTAINTIDLLMVGRLDDKVAVPGTAAIMASIVMLWAYGGFLSAVSVGTQALSARRYSEGSPLKAGQILCNSVLLSLTASTLLTIVAFFLVEPTMKLLSTNEEVRYIGSEFSKIRLLSLPTMAIMASFKSFYDGLGRVRIHMVVAIIMNITNAVFNYFLIFGHTNSLFSIPSLGVYGAAWGSASSSYIGILIMFLWSIRKKDRQLFKAFRLSNINLSITANIAKLSVWSGFAAVVLMLGVGLFNYIVSSVDALHNTGSVNSSAASIIIHVMMLVFMSCLAFGTSTATLVSQSIGAKMPKLAERYVWQCVILAVYIMSAFGIFTFLLPRPILTLFLPPDLDNNILKESVISIATPSLRIAALFLSPAAAAGMVLTQALYGAGETRYVMIVEFLLHFLCLAPLAWLLAIYFELGLMGCWIAAIIYGFGLAIATAYKFWQGSWKKLVL